MINKKSCTLVFIVVLMLAISGCSGSGDDLTGDNGDLALSLADAPVNNVESVFVTIEEVQAIRVEDGEEIKETVTDFADVGGEKKFDLLTLRFDEELLGQKSLPAGTYKQIRLIVAAAENGNGNGSQYADKSYVKFTDNSEEDLFIPSGSASGLKIKANEHPDFKGFTIEEGAITRLVADINVKEMMHSAGNSEKIILHPSNSISIINKEVSGDITGRVFADVNGDGDFAEDEVLDNPDYDVVVEAKQDGDVVKSTVATIEDLDDKPAGSYLLRGLEAGTYEISAKVMEENNDEEMVEVTNDDGNPLYQVQNTETVEVEAEAEVEVDLKLDKNEVQ